MDAPNNCDQGATVDLRTATETTYNHHVMFLNSDCSAGATHLDKNNDDRFGLILTEILRLRTQVSSLQAQIAAITHERDSASMLIWTEVSRLAHQLECLDSLRGENKAELDLSVPNRENASPTRALTSPQEVKFTDPVIIRTLLGDSNGCLPPNKSCMETNESSVSLSSNEVSQSEDRQASEIRLKHIKKRGRNSLEESDAPKRITSQVGGKHSAGGISNPPDALVGSTDQNNHIDCNKVKTLASVEATSDQLIQQWIDKQHKGEEERPDLPTYKSADAESEWWCHVCGTMARDGPPGKHFCWSKVDNGSRDGLKVFCHYCKKGTSRMPDLRVHFKKIVYCKLLRKELLRQYLENGASCEGGCHEGPAQKAKV